MFNPSTFSTHKKSITICNNDHPVLKYVSSAIAKKVPGKEGLYYIRAKDDSFMFTYRETDNSVQLWQCTYEEFKNHIKNSTCPENMPEVSDVPETDKYIGNVILNDILAYNL